MVIPISIACNATSSILLIGETVSITVEHLQLPGVPIREECSKQLTVVFIRIHHHTQLFRI